MPRPRLSAAAIVAACAAWIGPLAHAEAAHVDNFVLLDQQGAAHELYYLKDAAAIVLLVHGNGCPVVRGSIATYEKIRDAYAARGVEFLLINSNLQDDRASIAREAVDYGVDLPILDDETQLVGESLGLVRTGEVLVIDPTTWQVVYRGPIDDRIDFGRSKPAATAHYLTDALDALLGGRAIDVAKRDAVGCLINFPDRTADAASYSATIAPLLDRHCVACHHPGGIGPWAMTSYEMVRGFAPMIREVVRTKRMPPWHADPHVGVFDGDRSLSIAETRTLVQWIEAGAPRGDGPDPLATNARSFPDWPLGEPDLVLTLPPFDVPADGVVDYRYPFVPNPLDRDVWVRAATIAPGDRAVVHHALAGSVIAPPAEDDLDAVFDNYLIGYAPGAESIVYPGDTGVFVPKGGAFTFQMHYTPVGRPVRDVSRMALYFADVPPPHVMRHHVVLDPTIQIAPNDPAYADSAYLEFDHDAILYSVFPHAHYRGRSASFAVQYPDGRRELLLSVPRYDFNWQREYRFTRPVEVPAGARLVYTSVYDNSARNPGNPDPSRTVPWGLQSWDEMLYGAIMFRWRDERSDAPFHDPGRLGLRQMYGFVDADMNGRLELDEMPDRMHAAFEPRFAQADRNGDGGIDVDEYVGATAQRVGRR